MSQPAQLFQLASLVPVTLMRFRFVLKDLEKHEATYRMYGPGPKYYTEIVVRYAGTPFESVALGRALSLDEFLSCLRS